MNIEPDKLWTSVKAASAEKGIVLSETVNENIRIIDVTNGNLNIAVLDKGAYLELAKVYKDMEKKFNTSPAASLIGEINIELLSSYDKAVTRHVPKYPINNLDTSLTISDYVVGDNNLFAYEIALTMANNEVNHNPLVIYGDVGLGKTHLAQAIGNEILRKDPNKKILYTSSQDFSNGLVNSYIDKSTVEFKNRFKELDMLIVDDIQFFANIFGGGENKVQEEFFNAFNTLIIDKKPIILISDKYPDRIKNVDERLLSRFMAGATAELKQPDKSTRISIIKHENDKENIGISDELIDYIAENLMANVRVIKGIVKNIHLRKSLRNLDVDKALVDEVLNERLQREKEKITSQKVIEATKDYFGLSEADLNSKKRNKNIVDFKNVTRYLLVKVIGLSYTETASLTGGNDHTIITKTIQKIAKMDSSSTIVKAIEEIKKTLNN